MTDRERPRTKVAEPGASAIARVLREHDIPVPDSLAEIMNGKARPIPYQVADIDARRDRMLELEWPIRAVEVALDGEETNAIAAIRRWNPMKNSLVLAGHPGTGKTVAAAWCALHSPRNAVYRFVRASTLVRIGRFEDAWNSWLTAPALCIDDLGAEYVDAKGSFVSDLDELIDRFYSDRRPLLVTTNLDGREFKARYGARVLDRMLECASWEHVEGKSLRRADETPPPPWETK